MTLKYGTQKVYDMLHAHPCDNYYLYAFKESLVVHLLNHFLGWLCSIILSLFYIFQYKKAFKSQFLLLFFSGIYLCPWSRLLCRCKINFFFQIYFVIYIIYYIRLVCLLGSKQRWKTSLMEIYLNIDLSFGAWHFAQICLHYADFSPLL